MAKIRNWLNVLKKLFVSDAKDNREKREKKRRWITRRLKRKRLPALAAPSVGKERSIYEAEEDHTRHAWTAAIATAVAAQAAVASAQAAVEVIRLTGTPMSYHISNKGIRTPAAIKIQTAFRGYLARKALQALKGVVRLQAIVRGQAVRRQVITALNGLQTLVKIQSQLGVTKQCVKDKKLIENFNELGLQETRPELDSQRGRVDALPSKQDIDSLFSSKHEALIKRERVKDYLLSHRGRRNKSEADNMNGGLDHWLGQRLNAEERISRISPVQRHREERTGPTLRDYQDPLAGHTSPITPPRRSFDKPRRSSYEDGDPLGSPVVPNYMSVTESTKARLRIRSISLPKQGLGTLEYSDYGSPYKSKVPFSSISTDASSTIKSGKSPSSQQRSPSLRGLLGPIKSYQTATNLSVNSDSSFLYWSQHSGDK